MKNFLFDYLFTSYWGSKYWQYLRLDCVNAVEFEKHVSFTLKYAPERTQSIIQQQVCAVLHTLQRKC